jgi:hypothetical protein
MTEQPVRESAAEFAQVSPKIPALCRYPVKCGRPNCRCARGHLHESWRLVWWSPGRRRHYRYVRRSELAQVRAILAKRMADRQRARAERISATYQLRELSRLLRAFYAELSGD